MSIRTRLLLGFVLIVAAGFYLLVNWVRDDLRVRYLESMEESLVDSANVLASIVSTRVREGRIDARDFRAAFDETYRRIMPAKNAVTADLRVDYRRKGLVWYPTFVCDFAGTWTVANAETVAQNVQVRFAFPSARATYDRFSARIDGRVIDAPVNPAEGIGEIVELAPGEAREFRVTYRTRGLGEWRYRPDPATGRVRRLDLAVTTDFRDVDFPEGALSPMEKREAPPGMSPTSWTT